MEYVCKWCGRKGNAKPSVVKTGRKKYCSFECKHQGQRIAMTGREFTWGHKIGLAQIGRQYSEETLVKMSQVKLGKRNPMWTGKAVPINAHYTKVHRWIIKELGKPQFCQNCGDQEKGRYEWANVSHDYKYEISDWARLCPRCHRNYDMGRLQLRLRPLP